jgi:imidazole glycerol phosphate synthase subunit HisF
MSLKTRIIPCLDVMDSRATRSTFMCEDAQMQKSGQSVMCDLELEL